MQKGGRRYSGGCGLTWRLGLPMELQVAHHGYESLCKLDRLGGDENRYHDRWMVESLSFEHQTIWLAWSRCHSHLDLSAVVNEYDRRLAHEVESEGVASKPCEEAIYHRSLHLVEVVHESRDKQVSVRQNQYSPFCLDEHEVKIDGMIRVKRYGTHAESVEERESALEGETCNHLNMEVYRFWVESSLAVHTSLLAGKQSGLAWLVGASVVYDMVMARVSEEAETLAYQQGI